MHYKTFDEKVIYLMLLLSALFLALCAFRVVRKEPCEKIDFTFYTQNKTSIALAGEVVYFASVGNNFKAEEWEWDFGDKTPPNKTAGPYVNHKYEKAGQYVVRLTVNDRCQEFKNIIINNKGTVSKLNINIAWPPEVVNQGESYKITDNTQGATKWIWRKYGVDVPISYSNTLEISFDEPTEYVLSLEVAGEGASALAYKKIQVKPRAITTQSAPKVQTPQPAPATNMPQQPAVVDDASQKGFSMKDGYGTTKKAPPITAAELKYPILNVNNGSEKDLAKYFRNGNLNNCNIVFNSKACTWQQLKCNVADQNKDGETFVISDLAVDEQGYIKSLAVEAKLKPDKKNGFMGIGKKNKERKYCFERN